jgi:hypothetical protein
MLRRGVRMNVEPTEMWCDRGSGKGRLLCTIMNLNLPECTVFQVVTAPFFFALNLYVEKLY